MRSTGDEVRNAVRHTLVNAIRGIRSNIDELLPALLRLLPIADRTNTPTLGSHDLHVLNVREALCIGIDAAHRMPLHTVIRVTRKGFQFRITRYTLSTTVGVLEFSRGSTGSSTGCVLSHSVLPVTSGKASLINPSSATVPPKTPKNIFFLSLLIAFCCTKVQQKSEK